MVQKFKPYSLRSAFGVVPATDEGSEPQTTSPPPPPETIINPFVAPRENDPRVVEYVYIKPSCQRCRCSHCVKSFERQELLLWIIVLTVVFILIKVLSM